MKTTVNLTARAALRWKRAAIILVAAAAVAASSGTAAHAAGEDILVGAFDKITGVPVMSAMLAVVRSGESSSQSPEALDRRLREVERMLQDIDGRLKQVDVKVRQLQDQYVKLANLGRLRELQRIRAEIEEINAELLTHPTDPTRRAILEFRARQQADILKDNVDFDIWKWSDIDPGSGLIRTRFRVRPSFELYGLALTTWFSAIEVSSGAQPQQVVANSRAALREHAAFLRLRDGWRELRTDAAPGVPTDPVTLREHLYTAAFCRLGALANYSDHSGNCPFVEECIDNMEDRRTETGRVTLTMQPPETGILCTWNPDQALDFTGQDELRAEYGEEVMTAFANALDRLATSGSLREPFIGEFPNLVHTAIFSVSLDRPLQAQRGSEPGVIPVIARCSRFTGCVIGPESADLHWRIAGSTPVTIRHDGSNLCLDVKNNTPAAGASVVLWPCSDSSSTQKWVRRPLSNQSYALATTAGGLCLTVTPLPAGQAVDVDRARETFLQPCDAPAFRELQAFSGTDSRVIGPN